MSRQLRRLAERGKYRSRKRGPRLEEIVKAGTFRVCCQECKHSIDVVGTGAWKCPKCGAHHTIRASVLTCELVNPITRGRYVTQTVYAAASRLQTSTIAGDVH